MISPSERGFFLFKIGSREHKGGRHGIAEIPIFGTLYGSKNRLPTKEAIVGAVSHAHQLRQIGGDSVHFRAPIAQLNGDSPREQGAFAARVTKTPTHYAVVVFPYPTLEE